MSMDGKPSPLSRKIVRLMAKRGMEWPGGEENAYISRAHPAWAQRAAGALSWVLKPVKHDPQSNYPDVGSYYPASEVREDWNFCRSNYHWVFDPVPPNHG